MRYWWVNQKQTYRHEIEGAYMWSPKRNQNEGNNPYYNNMRAVAPGDIIFSYANGKIIAIGIATSIAYESPIPTEFGDNWVWNNIGWRVSVRYSKLLNKIAPKDNMQLIVPHLPEKYSPIQPNGHGNQVYLCSIGENMASVLVNLI